VESGQYLDTIADDIYGDPGRWRLIAEANDIDDPLDLPPGRRVVIPELEG
jgi:nucleoid-associated protein YgaU